MDVINKLKKKGEWKNYCKDIKGIKIGFIFMLISASFVFSLAMAHTYQGLNEDTRLYLFSIFAYLLSFLYKYISIRIVNSKYKQKIS